MKPEIQTLIDQLDLVDDELRIATEMATRLGKAGNKVHELLISARLAVVNAASTLSDMGGK